MIYWFGMTNEKDLHGFVQTLINNDYEVTLSRPGRRIKAEVWKVGEKHECMQELRSANQMDQDGNRENDAGEYSASLISDSNAGEGVADIGYSRGEDYQS